MSSLLPYAATRISPSSSWHRATSLLRDLTWSRHQPQSEHPPLGRGSPASAFALHSCHAIRRQVHDESRNSVPGTPSSQDGSAAGNEGEARKAQGGPPQVPVVPGVLFRITAGDSAVNVEHVAGWSDVATIQGRPSAGRAWRAVLVAVGAGAGADVAASGDSPQVRQTYDVSANSDTPLGVAATPDGSGKDVGLLRLAVPEKWVSLDIFTTGRPVSVSKVVEADLRVATQGAPLTLGSVRGLQVHLVTSSKSAAPAAPAASAAADGEGGGAGGGSVKGGEVSGTAVTIVADGPIALRRLIGGNMSLEASAVAAAGDEGTTGSGSPEPCPEARAALGGAPVTSQSPPHCKPSVALGAVYGRNLQIRTGGGAVRVGTLDCGLHVGGGATAAGVSSESASGAVSDGDCGDSKGWSDLIRSCGDLEGGARILSYGGSVTLDSLEGAALVDSGGGSIKVLVQEGIRTCKLLSGGGNVDLALSYSTALADLEIRGAGLLQVDPGLEPSLKDIAANNTGGSAAPAGCTGGGVWRAALAPGPDGARVGGRGLDPGSGRGRLLVDACGGTVSVRRLGWMDALRAKIAEQQAQHA